MVDDIGAGHDAETISFSHTMGLGCPTTREQENLIVQRVNVMPQDPASAVVVRNEPGRRLFERIQVITAVATVRAEVLAKVRLGTCCVARPVPADAVPVAGDVTRLLA